jgi:hypothetical protein
MPTADMLDPGALRLEWERDGYPSLLSGEGESYLLTQVGLSERLEAGVDIYQLEDARTLAFNAKYLLMRGAGKRPALALGLLDLGHGLKPAWYLSAGRDVGGVRAHLGASRCGNRNGALAGVEYELPWPWPGSGRRPSLYILADWASGEEGYGTLGLYWETAGGLGINVAYGWPNDSGGSDLVVVNILRTFSLK